MAFADKTLLEVGAGPVDMPRPQGSAVFGSLRGLHVCLPGREVIPVCVPLSAEPKGHWLWPGRP